MLSITNSNYSANIIQFGDCWQIANKPSGTVTHPSTDCMFIFTPFIDDNGIMWAVGDFATTANEWHRASYSRVKLTGFEFLKSYNASYKFTTGTNIIIKEVA